MATTLPCAVDFFPGQEHNPMRFGFRGLALKNNLKEEGRRK